MTIASTELKIQYSPNGSTKTFAFPYLFLEDSHLVVTLTISSIDVLQTLNSDYSVAGAGVAGGGSITFSTAPISGTTLTINRTVPITQETDYIQNDNFPAESHESALDKLTMICQQLKKAIERCLRFPDTDLETLVSLLPAASGRVDGVLVFDGDGNATVTNLATLISAISITGGTSFTISSPAGTATQKSVTISVDSVGVIYLVRAWLIDGTHSTPTIRQTLNTPNGTSQTYYEALTDTNGDVTFTFVHTGAATAWKLCVEITGSIVLSEAINLGV